MIPNILLIAAFLSAGIFFCGTDILRGGAVGVWTYLTMTNDDVPLSWWKWRWVEVGGGLVGFIAFIFAYGVLI